jgi:hypothetical protein
MQSQLPRPSDEPINLIIAVSFGLFVPPRILKNAEYRGLNIHPSLLPKYVNHNWRLLQKLTKQSAFVAQLHYNILYLVGYNMLESHSRPWMKNPSIMA